jgi:DNA-binding MarR family transcriptional regulator
MDPEQAAQEFASIFPEIYRRFRRRIHHSEFQLTSESLAVLRHLAESGPLTITECADHMDRSQAAMSEMIDRLVRREVLSKMADERDRRRSLVWLTDRGFAKLDEANRVLSETRLLDAFANLTSDERSRLLADLGALLDQKEETDEH